SSRKRHTRSKRDWSSDVCSSDLKIKITAKGSRGGYGNFYTYAVSDTTKSGRGASCTATFEFKKGDKLLLLVGQHGKDAATTTGRSEERRVGKEMIIE